MGLDYSYLLYFERRDLKKVLQRLALRAKPGDGTSRVIFPDGDLTLPWDPLNEEERTVPHDHPSVTYMTTLYFPEDEEIRDYVEGPSPGESHPLGEPISYIYLTVYNDLSLLEREAADPRLVLLEFATPGSKMSALFSLSSSIKEVFTGLLREFRGALGVFNTEEEGRVFWLKDHPVDWEIPDPYMLPGEIAPSLFIDSTETDTPKTAGLPLYCSACGELYYPGGDDPFSCPRCGGAAETEGASRDLGGTRLLDLEEALPREPGVTRTAAAAETSREAGPEGPPALNPGEWREGNLVLGLYQIKEVFASGGMGLVYRARHTIWGMDLVMKTPRPEVVARAGGSEAFAREAETWMGLGLHPHIVTCHYVREIYGVPRVFAEYVDGGSLKDWIKDRRLYAGGHQQALERILDAAIQFAWGLGYAHQRGLIHQDVKPANVLLTPGGVAKVTDFGLAAARPDGVVTVADGRGRDRQATTAMMTPAYCSPEQAERGVLAAARVPPKEWPKLTRATDTWSFAVSLLEVFNGELTWPTGVAAPFVLEGLLREGPADPGLPSLPGDLAEILGQCFQEKPENRPQDMLKLAEGLQAIYERETGRPYPREFPAAAELRADSLNNRALSFLDLGQVEQAERALQSALEMNALHPEATFNQALLSWRQGKRDDLEAVTSLEKLLDSQKEKWPTAYLLGLTHIDRCDMEKAFEALQGLEGHEEVRQVALETHLEARLLWAKKSPTRVETVSFSPDGSIIVLGGITDRFHALPEGDGNSIFLWESATGKRLKAFDKERYGVNTLAFTPNGRYVLSGSNNYTMSLWDIKQGIRVWSQPHTSLVKSVDVSPDGRFCLSATTSGTLALWELKTRNFIRNFQGLSGPWVTAAVFSSDGRYILSASNSKDDKIIDHNVQLWDVETGKCLRTFKGRLGYVTCVALSPDGRYALSGSTDTSLRLWDIESGACLRNLTGPGLEIVQALSPGMVWAAAFSPDGRLILANKGSDVKIWETETGKCLRTFTGPQDRVKSVAFSPDGHLAVSASDFTVRLWNIQGLGTFKAPFRLVIPISGSQAAEETTVFAAYMGQGKAAFAKKDYPGALEAVRKARGLPGYERSEEAMSFWFDLYSCCRRVTLKKAWEMRALAGHKDSVNRVAMAPDGRYALSAGWDGILKSNVAKLWNLGTGECSKTFQKPRRIYSPVAFCPEGYRAFTTEFGGTMLLWNLETGGILQDFKVQKGGTKSAVFSPDGRFILSGGGDGNLRLWDVALGRCLRTWKGHAGGVAAVTFSPDGLKALSVGGDGALRLWNMGKFESVYAYTWDKYRALTVSVSPDGRLAVTGGFGDERNLALWEVATGKPLRILSGHKKGVEEALFSPDGSYLFSRGLDETLRLWEVSSGQCLNVFRWGKAESLALSPDGRYLLLAATGALRLWALDWELKACPTAAWKPLSGRKPTSKSSSTPWAVPATAVLRPGGVRKKLEDIKNQV